VANINRALEDIKSDVIADFICANNRGLTITTNKVASILDLNTIEKYIKNVNAINLVLIQTMLCHQDYLNQNHIKLLEILYLIEDTNTPMSANIVKRVLQSIYIFNNIVLTFKPYIIKASLKLDMAVI